MAFCPKCGNSVADDAAFCPGCGCNVKTQTGQTISAVVPPSVSAASVQQPSSFVQAGRKSNTVRNIGIVVVIVVLALIALAALGAFNSGGSGSLGGSAPQQYTQNIVNGLITVGAGDYNTYQFTCPGDSSGCSVQGSFTASGGSGNDIIVLILDSTDYINWQNGHQASAYYNSGQLTTSSISASVPAGGTYYLVYDNTFSAISSKNVQTTVNLNYTS